MLSFSVVSAHDARDTLVLLFARGLEWTQYTFACIKDFPSQFYFFLVLRARFEGTFSSAAG
ncbi:hypothetical protein AcV5_007141 [Taiwanofungus camphoratus]|nr:hypothetical protein AcV5_007141 [Antrodia cinnamomea]KAI0958653.1 hypothetical protein AcV7_004406 [Antrodia cinnamomea]